MTTNVDSFNSAGLERLYWALNNSSGYVMGSTGSIANGSDAGMSRAVGVQTFNLPMQPPRQVSVGGDDDVQAIYFFNPEQLPNGDLVLGNVDLTLWAKALGIKVYADGDFDVVVGQPDSPTFGQFTVVSNSQAKSAASGSVGNAGWMVKIYPKVQLVPIGDQGLANAAASSFTHRVIANKSGKLPWGASFTTTNHGTTGGAMLGPFFSENRVTMHTHVADGSDLTFTLTYLPAAATTNKVKAWRNGTALVYTSDFTVSASTGVVTLAAAGTAGDIVVVRYEHL